MRIYSSEQDDQYCLSPYLDISYTDGRLMMHQRLFDTVFSICCSKEQADLLCGMLERGTDENELLALLERITRQKDAASDCLTAMMQTGVLE